MTDHIAPDLAAYFDQEDARLADQIRRFGVPYRWSEVAAAPRPAAALP
jgi:hypothetical protein